MLPHTLSEAYDYYYIPSFFYVSGIMIDPRIAEINELIPLFKERNIEKLECLEDIKHSTKD